jgi:hypothetical protein
MPAKDCTSRPRGRGGAHDSCGNVPRGFLRLGSAETIFGIPADYDGKAAVIRSDDILYHTHPLKAGFKMLGRIGRLELGNHNETTTSQSIWKG